MPYLNPIATHAHSHVASIHSHTPAIPSLPTYHPITSLPYPTWYLHLFVINAWVGACMNPSKQEKERFLLSSEDYSLPLLTFLPFPPLPSPIDSYLISLI